MNKFITSELFKDYLLCKNKAYLKITGKVGIKSEFVDIENNFYGKYFYSVYSFLKSKYVSAKTISNVSLTTLMEKQFDIAFNIIVKNDKFSVIFDAVLSDTQANHSYMPVIFVPGEKIKNNDKLLLSFYSYIFAETTTVYPSNGTIIFGHKMTQRKINLDNFKKETISILKALLCIFDNEKAPPFYLNKHCSICDYKNDCLNSAKEKDDLSILSGLRESRIKKLNDRGIFTVKQFSYTFRPKRLKNKLSSPYLPELKALAIRDKKVYIHRLPKIPLSEVEIYFDIEGLPNENYYYLIGVFINENGRLNEYSFWAENRNDQSKIIDAFLNIMKTYQNAILYHYGNYEKKFLKEIIRYSPEESKQACNYILNRSYNVLSNFSREIYVPTYSDGLKDVANFLGFKWSDKNASGIQSIVWRKRWELSGEQYFKSKIIQYNIEDCLALKCVKEWLCKLNTELDSNSSIDQFAKVDSIFNENIKKWGKPNYQIEDFNKIHNYAYFDYQRTKIFLRTDKKIKRTIKNEISEKSKLNRIDKKIVVYPDKCPICRSDRFLRLKEYSKVLIDLKFTKSSIKKSIIKYQGGRFKCQSCGEVIVPIKLNRIPKYGDNLVSWSINQHIKYRVGLNKVAEMLTEYFKIRVSIARIYSFKLRFCLRYGYIASELINNLKNGLFISADETGIKVHGFASPYVWVFANLDTVLYIFRPNREGHFLNDFLANSKSVIISDFYSVYDSLQCPQQKCLIHLIRDLNGDLINNQFDQELKDMVLDFGKLMRMIIEKIDKYGLKKRYLNTHMQAADKFLEQTVKNKYKSEIALKYQKRLFKYKDKLFTFLKFDGIPWNNNIAEHCIKPFAKYRRENQGVFTENSIKDYLLLLSIQQTCKLRGINFFEFLKSKRPSLNELS